MAWTQQGSIKAVAVAGGTSTVVFDSVPAAGDLIVLAIINATDGFAFPAGFTQDAFSNPANSQNVAFAHKIAGGAEVNSYACTSLGANAGTGAMGWVIRSSLGGLKAVELVTTQSGTALTGDTIDPAGNPSGGHAAYFTGARLTAAGSLASYAFNGGGAQTFSSNSQSANLSGRSYAAMLIVSAVPADSKVVLAFGTSVNFADALLVYVEQSALTVALGQATERDQAFLLGAMKTVLPATATEHDTAFAMSAVRQVMLSHAEDSEFGGALGVLRQVGLGAATEADVATALAAIVGIIAPVGHVIGEVQEPVRAGLQSTVQALLIPPMETGLWT